MDRIKVKSGVRISEKLRDLYSETIETYEHNERRINELDGLQQDKLHKLEWSNPSASQACKIAKELQEIRIDRRRMKYENESLKPVYDYLKPKTKMKEQLDSVVGESRRLQGVILNKKYSPRYLTDEKDSLNELSDKFKNRIEWE